MVSQSRPSSIRLRRAFCRAYMPLVGPLPPMADMGDIPECHQIKRNPSGDGDEASLAMRCQRDQ